MPIDKRKLAEELQKAKFRGESASEVLKRLTLEQEKSKQKKEVAPAVAPDAGSKQGEPVPQNILNKAKSFTQAMLSRGLNNNKASQETISLRVLSCHGNDADLAPCPKRMDSTKFPGSHYCGACGCGDKQLTQLTPFKNGDKMVDYTKIHYPKVSCPLEMPGFTNYKSSEENPKTANDRKLYIEVRNGVDDIKSKSTPST